MSLIPKFLLGSAMSIAVFPLLAGAQTLTAGDRDFISEAAKAGMHEVHMGNMGLQKGSSQNVKGFSQRLVNDHTKGNQELAALAKKKGVSLPSDDANENSMPIAKKSGADFDKAFAAEMVEGHEKAIALFEKESNSAGDPDLKKWATDTLPTLRSHLKEAQSLPHS